MAVVAISDSILTDIADAIRSKNGQETLYKPSEMPEAIEAISGGGITPTGTIEITQNGVVDVTNYASADVDVPTPTPSLGTKTITQNGTYDAEDDSLDGYSEVTVNVSGGITPTGTKQISITQNGTTTEDVTNYANAEITVNVSGGGGLSDFELIDTLTVSDVHSYQIDIGATWLSDYVCVLIVPDLTISTSDWIYVCMDQTTGGNYTDKVTTFGNDYTMILSGYPSVQRVTWWKNSNSSNSMLNVSIANYLYVYAYTSSSKMNGTFKIYGMRR